MTRKNRKDVEIEISSEKADRLYTDLVKWSGNDLAGFMFEGALLDEYVVVMTGNQNWKLNLSKGRPILARKYVYTEEKYLNCWSSKLVLVLTDSEKRFRKFLKSRFINESNYDEFCYESGLND